MKKSTILLLVSIVIIGLFIGEINEYTGEIFKSLTGKETTCIPKTCEEIGYECDAADDGCGGDIICGTCPPDQICGPDHKCVAPIKDICEDTDGGKDYFVKGIVFIYPEGTSKESGASISDGCNGNFLTERYCNPDGSFGFETYTCAKGCEDGVCLEIGEELPTQPECTDSDNGEKQYIRGMIIDKIVGTKTDKCVYYPENPPEKKRGVIEYSCKDTADARGSFAFSKVYYCQYGCENGACFEETQICIDTTWSSWSPLASTICEGEMLTQTKTSNCGTEETRQEMGTKTIGECATTQQCIDTCSSLNYECETHTICGIETDCGTCAIEEQVSCQLTNAYWSPTSAKNGDIVTLTLEGTNCNEEIINFDVYEDDTLSNSYIISIQNIPFTSGKAETTWIAEYIDDGFLQGDPEYFFTAYLTSDNTIRVNSNKLFVTQLTTTERCPTGQVEHRGYCKPKILDLNLDYSKPHSYKPSFGKGDGGIYDTELFNFNYPPLIDKANELIQGKTNTYDKVKAIANYIRNSKLYDNTYSPGIESLQSYWGMDRGKCFHAAQITMAMLNVVDIPALHYDVYAINHAQTLVNIDGVWGVIDSTFFKMVSLDQDDLEIYAPTIEDMRQIPLFITEDNLGEYPSWDEYPYEEGDFCNMDKSLCLEKRFSMLRIMTNPLYPSNMLLLPLAQRFVIWEGWEDYTFTSKREYSCELILPYKCVGGCTESYNDLFKTRLGYSSTSLLDTENYPVLNSVLSGGAGSNNVQVKSSRIGYIKLDLPKSSLQYEYICYRVPGQGETINKHPVTKNIFALENPVKITWNNLQKTAEATQQEYDDVVNYIKSTTEDLGIDI